MKTYHTLSDDNGEPFDVVCEWQVIPPHRGARDSLGGKRGAGPPLEPDEDADVELVSCKLDLAPPYDKDYELTDDQFEDVYDDALVELADQAPDINEDEEDR